MNSWRHSVQTFIAWKGWEYFRTFEGEKKSLKSIFITFFSFFYYEYICTTFQYFNYFIIHWIPKMWCKVMSICIFFFFRACITLFQLHFNNLGYCIFLFLLSVSFQTEFPVELFSLLFNVMMTSRLWNRLDQFLLFLSNSSVVPFCHNANLPITRE